MIWTLVVLALVLAVAFGGTAAWLLIGLIWGIWELGRALWRALWVSVWADLGPERPPLDRSGEKRREKG